MSIMAFLATLNSFTTSPKRGNGCQGDHKSHSKSMGRGWQEVESGIVR